MTKYLLLSAAAIMMFGFAPQASAMDDATHAGEALVEATAEMSAEAEAVMEEAEDCAEYAMEGDHADTDHDHADAEHEAKDDCVSKTEEATDAEVDSEAVAE